MRTITALYDSREPAETARRQLAAAGVEPSAVQITSSDVAAATIDPGEGRGFLQSLKDFFMPDEDRHAYHEGVRRGGYLLSARVDETQADQACRILDDSGAIDFDERQQQWRSEGWTGRDENDRVGRSEQTIPVVEEQLRVGKREVERGGVRVRSYIEETPVQEQVELREEHVEIERRPVNEPVRDGNADTLFQERSIELTERGEEAVVAKEAVVREEISIRKDVDQRTETIADTVRHTELDVDDTRDAAGELRDDGRRFDDARDRNGVIGERASFGGRDQEDHSLAMDPEGSSIEETEEERRARLDEGRPSSRPSY